MDFEKKEFYGIVAKAKKQMQITIDQDCNVADTKPDVEKMIQTRGIVKIQETEMMVDRVRIKGEFVFQGLYGTMIRQHTLNRWNIHFRLRNMYI